MDDWSKIVSTIEAYTCPDFIEFEAREYTGDSGRTRPYTNYLYATIKVSSSFTIGVSFGTKETTNGKLSLYVYHKFFKSENGIYNTDVKHNDEYDYIGTKLRGDEFWKPYIPTAYDTIEEVLDDIIEHTYNLLYTKSKSAARRTKDI